MSILSRAFDMLSGAGLALVVFIAILTFGSAFVADLGAQVDTDYGNTSTAAQVIDQGEAGLLDMASYTDLVVLAIVFVIILALIFVVKRQSDSV